MTQSLVKHNIGDIRKCLNCGEEITMVGTDYDVDWDYDLDGTPIGRDVTVEVWVHKDTGKGLCESLETGAYPKG